MCSYIEKEKLGRDFVYNLKVSTEKDDFSPLILNEDGGIEEGMFLDLFLIFRYMERSDIFILPFLRKCFHLIEDKCSQEEIDSLFKKSELIQKGVQSNTYLSMLGLNESKRSTSILKKVIKDSEILSFFNETTVEKIHTEVEEGTSAENTQKHTLSFSLRDCDKHEISPLIKVLAGISSKEEMSLEGKEEDKAKILAILSETETSMDATSKEKMNAFLAQIENQQIKGELVVSFGEI